MGAEKIFGGAQVNFFSNSGVKTKKRFSSQITPSGYGPFASFRGTILTREDTFIAWRGATEFYGADLGSSPQIQG